MAISYSVNSPWLSGCMTGGITSGSTNLGMVKGSSSSSAGASASSTASVGCDTTVGAASVGSSVGASVGVLGHAQLANTSAASNNMLVVREVMRENARAGGERGQHVAAEIVAAVLAGPKEQAGQDVGIEK